jgi:hypothetical protein
MDGHEMLQHLQQAYGDKPEAKQDKNLAMV